MKICIQLAQKGLGKVSPNPLVGCVLLDKNNNIIADGYHSRYGENHAERDALLKIKAGEAETLVVNLEPCSHYGKTPPCTDIIIEKGIKRVVIGMKDINPKVSGIQVLKNSGIEVIESVLQNECLELNEVFIKNMKLNKTFVAIKTATTLDGKISTLNGSSKWITSQSARDEVKNIRYKYDAIMTTSSTVIRDNPKMLHRKKVVLDRELKTNIKSEIYNSGEIYVFHDNKMDIPQNNNIHYIPTPVKDSLLSLEFILNKLYEFGIYSVLVEAGGKLNGSILKYTDKIYQFVAPKIIGDNCALSCFDYRHVYDISDSAQFSIRHIKIFEPDILLEYYPVGN